MTTSNILQDMRNIISGTNRDDKSLFMKKFEILDSKLSEGHVIPSQWMDKHTED